MDSSTCSTSAMLSPRQTKHRRSTPRASPTRGASVENDLLSTDFATANDFTNWNFNVFELETPKMQLAFVQRLSAFFELHTTFGLSMEAIGQFYVDVQQGYMERTTQPVVARRYHTFLHAVDVMQSVAVFLRGFQGTAYVSPLTASALLIASLCHDVGHVGLTNQFLVNSGHPLTLEYRSPVLESMHTARTMVLVKQHGFLTHLPTQESLRVAKTIARCIMYTDVSIHSELLRKTRAIAWRPGQLAEEDSYVYCGFLLHTADICNPAKEWSLAQHWTDLIMSEFFEQGALEKREGLVVSTFRNADQINTSEIQANFVRLMLQPTLSLMAEFLPNSAFLKDIAEGNRKQWEADSLRALTAPQVELIRALSRPLVLHHLTRREQYLEKLTRFCDNDKVIAGLFVASLYATFSDNVRIASSGVEGDVAFGICTCVVLAVMLADVILSAIVMPRYRYSFYFWLDLVAAVTLLTEVSFINGLQVDATAHAGSGSLTKTPALRLARLLRMLRMATLFKLFKQALVKHSYRPRRQSRATKAPAAVGSADSPPATFSAADLKRICSSPVYTLEHVEQLVRGAYRGVPPPTDALRNFCARIASSTSLAPMRSFKFTPVRFHKVLMAMEDAYERDMNSTNKISQLNFYASRLGEKVADTTLRHVIFLLLAVLIILTECTMPRDVSPRAYGLQKLHMWAQTGNAGLLREVAFYTNATQPVYLYLAGANATAVHNAFAPLAADPWPLADVVFDGHALYGPRVTACYRVEYLTALYFPSACEWPSTTLPCQSIAVFDGGAEARTEAVWEIVRTLFIISCFASGGMLLTLDVYKRVILPVERMVNLTQQLALNPTKSVVAEDEEKPMYEMKLLQNTLTKVARLLQIGYGSAGSAIISRNMMGADFDPIIAGKKVHAVFGFCDIRRFTDITECLQEQVMMFTNTIGHLVHHAAYTFDGHANKNVGDAFLLVWKIPEDSPDVAVINQARPPAHLATTSGAELDYLFFDKEGNDKMAQSKMYVATVADNALMAVLKTMVDIDISPKLKAYKTNKQLQARFESPFQVKMGYGLHVGWAIDGAHRWWKGTDACVGAIGSKYKIDASYLSSDVNMASTLESTTKLYHIPLIMSHSFYNLLSPMLQQFCRCIDCVLFDGSSKPTALYTCDYVNPNVRHFRGIADVPLLQMGLLNGFTSTFEKGVNEYLVGNWAVARDTLSFLLATLKPHDGPAEALMEFMGRSDFAAPADWPGYRKLA
ncbi:hypothetical protein ACHHYP_16555 [Achlya hypogyna]|uniref:Phosphodiesterase n=1 Tax=Achlya hypogyna TaxID=1202772 RepID=A0A1V9ZDW5_ACHHY|nr:hypothetical protein ACHHYP_16555 [Achlya hypogyna]